MKTLNSFLNRLPELVVDNLMFERSREHSTLSGYTIRDGVWKLRKIGYKEYEARKLIESSWVHVREWTSIKEAGDIDIIGIRVSLTSVIVTLGQDARGQ